MDKGKEIGEKELALSCAKGDIMARKELYNRYATRLYSLCTRYLQDPEEGRDLMHDTMIKAFNKIGRFNYRGESSLYAWLSKMAVNMVIERMRKEARIKFEQIREDVSDAEDPDLDFTMEIPLAELKRMVSSLPESKRTVFNLFYVEGYSHKEISKLMGISVSTSTSTLAKAKKSLAKMVNEYIEKRR